MEKKIKAYAHVSLFDEYVCMVDVRSKDRSEPGESKVELVGEGMTQRSDRSLVICDIPSFIVEDNNKEIYRDKILAFFARLTPEAITNKIIADSIMMAKSKTFYMSIGVINLARDVLPDCIVNEKRFYRAMVKVEIEKLNVDLGEYLDGIRPREKIGRPTVIEQEFNYKSWEQCPTNHPMVEIIGKMHVKDCTTFRAFR